MPLSTEADQKPHADRQQVWLKDTKVVLLKYDEGVMSDVFFFNKL